MLTSRKFLVYDNMLKELYHNARLADFRPTVLKHLPDLIPCDSMAFFLVDPETHFFMEPSFSGMDGRSFNEYKDYYEEKDIYKRAVFSDKRIPAVDRCSDYMDYAQWEKNEHRSDFLLRHGIYHIACLQVLNGGRLVGEISLHRGKKSRDFSNRDVETLNMLHNHINSAFENACLLSFGSLADLLEGKSHPGGKGFCVLDGCHSFVYANDYAEGILPQRLVNGKKVMEYIKDACRDIDYRRSIRPYGRPYTMKVILSIDTGGQYSCSVIFLDNENNYGSLKYLAIFGEHTLFIKNSAGKESPKNIFSDPALWQYVNPHLEIRFLGGMEVLVDGVPVPEKAWQTRKARTLFKYLVLKKGRRVSRDQLMEFLWPGSEPASAAASLRVTLTRLRKALAQPVSGNGSKTPFFGDERGLIWFNPGGEYILDTEEFEKKVGLGLVELKAGNAAEAVEYLEQALAIYRGDLLEEDLYEDWAAPERERLQIIYLDTLDTLARLYLDAGGKVNHGRARSLLQRALAINPYHEQTYLALMEVCRAGGEIGEALRLYEKCRKMLAEEFGAWPGPVMVKLVEDIRGKEKSIKKS